MIKLKSLLEQTTQRNYDSEIQKLEQEWERLDDMGNQNTKQQEIGNQIKKLQTLRDRWIAMYKATKLHKPIPKFLYHATFMPNLPKINTYGLLPHGGGHGHVNLIRLRLEFIWLKHRKKRGHLSKPVKMKIFLKIGLNRLSLSKLILPH